MRFLLPIFAAIFLSACLPTESGAGGVAIIDLDKVAQALGRDKVIADDVQERIKREEERINLLRDELRTELETKQMELGEQPAEEDLKAFQQMRVQTEIRLRQEVSQAQKIANEKRIEMIQVFRNEVQPVARRVAKENGMTLVMVKDAGHLFIDPTADITEKVIDAMQTSGTPKPASSKPAGSQ